MKSPSVTVGICTLNREEVLQQTLHDIWAQDYEPLELIVVDQTENLSPAMESFYRENANRLKLIRMEAKGQGQARNRVLREATGEVTVFFDDDIRLKGKTIWHHAKHYSDPKVGAVAGRVDDAHGDPPCCGARVNWFGKVVIDRDISHIHTVESVIGCNMSVRTNVARERGFWELPNNTVQMREETDASLAISRAGYQIICEPEAHILHLAFRSGGSRNNATRIRWYEDYFFAEFSYFFRNFPKWKLPLYLLVLIRPIVACSFYYGKGSAEALAAPWKGLKRAWQ